MRTIEQNTQIPYSEKVTSRTGKAKLALQHTFFGPVERFGLNNILVGTNDEYPENFGDEYLRAIAEDYWPIAIGNHRAHVDGVLFSKVTRVLTRTANERLPKDGKMEGFALIMAASLQYGHQGAMLKGFLDDSYPILDANETVPFYNVRPQDRRRYKMRTDYHQERDDLVNAIKDGWALVVFPEGQTKAGKTNEETGKSFGMIPFMNGSIISMVDAVYLADRKPLIIPFSISGGSRVQNANTRLPSLGSVRAGLGIGKMHMADIKVHSPVKCDGGQIAEFYSGRDKEGLNTFVAKLVAQGLPEEERGVYT